MAGNVEWRTPEEIFAICSEAWGPIGLDAAASHDNFMGGQKFITAEEDGLRVDWGDRIGGLPKVTKWAAWVNPPFRNLIKWVEKSIREADAGLQVIMLLPNDTDTRWFRKLMSRSEMYITRGRIRFLDPEGRGRSHPRQGHIVSVLRPPVTGLIRPTGILGSIRASHKKKEVTTEALL